jgi:hypothetical protein
MWSAEIQLMSITREAVQSWIDDKWNRRRPVGAHGASELVPRSFLPSPQPDDSRQVQLVRQLDEDNGGRVEKQARRFASARWNQLWYGASVIDDRSAAITKFALREYEPLDAVEVWATVRTAWQLNPDLTEQRFLEADPRRVPIAMAGAVVADTAHSAAEKGGPEGIPFRLLLAW